MANINGTTTGLFNNDDVLNGTSGDDVITADPSLLGGGNDIVNGNGGNDVILGGQGNDILNGGDGQDTLNGAFGADTLQGGQGSDVYSVDLNSLLGVINVADQDTFINAASDRAMDVIEFNDNSLANLNTLLSAMLFNPLAILSREGNNLLLDYGLPFGLNAGDRLVTIGDYYSSGDNRHLFLKVGEQLIDLATLAPSSVLNGGAGNDSLIGEELYDTINGGEGNDFIDGGLGIDTLVGGLGDDTYVVDNTSDTIAETVIGGNDTVSSSTINVVLTNYANVENATLLGASDLSLTGGAGNNILTGNSGNNVISGGDGNDTLMVAQVPITSMAAWVTILM